MKRSFAGKSLISSVGGGLFVRVIKKVSKSSSLVPPKPGYSRFAEGVGES